MSLAGLVDSLEGLGGFPGGGPGGKLAGLVDSLEGLGGFPRAKFSGLFSWIDGDKPAGHTSQRPQVGFRSACREICTLRHFFYSPYSVWFLVSMALYVCFPYEIEAAREGWAPHWVVKRIAIIEAAVFLTYGLFWWAFYVYGVSSRKYRPGAYPTVGNMVHNMWYCALGALQWALWECAMTRLYAVGKVAYIPDEELLRSPSQMLVTALLVLAMPVWREHHFCFLHRFAHIRGFYKYVHALHHRNADTEPFSGFCQHPVEHLLYFAATLTPVLYFRCSPLVFCFMFVHLCLSPAMSHSGYEDHWSADQFHYVHHAMFECNYGVGSSAWIDIACGTFREKLGASGEYEGAYNGDYEVEEEKEGRQGKEGCARVFSAQSYLGAQSEDHMVYTLFCLLTTTLLFLSAMRASTGQTAVLRPQLVGAVVAYGPVVFAMLLSAHYDRMSWRWPFHKEHVLGTFGLFVVIGWATCMLPVQHFVTLLCTA